MSFSSWILGCITYWSSFLPLVVRTWVQNWKERADRVLSAIDEGEIYGSLADAALELHTISRQLYLSSEKAAKKYRATSILWDRHLQFPLNNALRTFKRFSKDLRYRGGGIPNQPASFLEWITDAKIKNVRRAVASRSAHISSRNIRDLSSEIKLLGDFPAAQGVVSSIWLGEITSRPHFQVAIKLFIPTRATALGQEFIREALVWSRASLHENIMPLLGIAQLRGSLALVSPWMPERDLGTYLSTHSEVNRLQLLADVARGLSYLHSQGIVYGNLRLTTIVVSDMGRAYLSSFLVAHSRDDHDDAPPNALNSLILAPELLNEDNPLHKESKVMTTSASDVFTYGTVCIQIFDAISVNKDRGDINIRHILAGRVPERPRSLAHLGLTDDFWLLVTSCWNHEPVQRPTMSEVARRMVQFAEAFTPAALHDAARGVASQSAIRDISAEIKRLGEYPIAGGGYCDLYLGERLGDEKVALKLVRLVGSTVQDKDAARRRFMTEARLWAEFQHPRILHFYGICEYGTLSLYMVSPWLENGNIDVYLAAVKHDADRYQLLRETAEGLDYLHSRNPPVVHGDLKAANILITSAGTAVLADFGLSKFSNEATTTVLQGAGSPRWMAPELILAGDHVSGPLKTPKSDIYAFGHVMLEVLSGKKPFFHLKEDVHVIVELIRGRRSPRPDGLVADKWLNDESWATSRKCTSVNPETRPAITDLLTKL